MHNEYMENLRFAGNDIKDPPLFLISYFQNIFRCYVTHRIPVSYPLSHNFDNSKTSEHKTNYVGGTFSQLFDIRANPGSILITKSPKLIEEGLVGGSISLECEAEMASEVISSTGNDQNCTLQYQW